MAAIQVASAQATINNDVVGGGLNAALNPGAATTQMASQAYAFLTANNMIGQEFLGQTITNGQNMYQSQIAPLAAGLSKNLMSISNLTNANAKLVNTYASVGAISNKKLMGYQQAFSTNLAYLEQSQQNQANNALSMINTISQGSLSVSRKATNSGSASFLATALAEHFPTEQNIEMRDRLNAWRDGWVCSNRHRYRFVLIYFRVSPVLIGLLREMENARDVWAFIGMELKACDELIQSYEEEYYIIAFKRYFRLIYFLSEIVAFDLEGDFEISPWFFEDQDRPEFWK